MTTDPEFIKTVDSLPEFHENWIHFFELAYSESSTELSSEALVHHQLECLKLAGFHIIRTEMTDDSDFEDDEEEETEKKPTYQKKKKDKAFKEIEYEVDIEPGDSPVDVMVMVTDDAQVVLDDIFTEEINWFQSGWIMFHFGLERELFEAGLKLFVQQVVEARSPMRIVGVDADEKRESRLRTKGAVYIQAFETTKLVRQIQSKIFLNNGKLEKIVRSRTKSIPEAQISEIQELRKKQKLQ